MPSLNIYEDILKTWHRYLTEDARIGGRDIRVIYSRREPEDLDINLMPYIQYFLDRNWSDEAHGTGSFSPQSRRVNLSIGFLLAMAYGDAAQLDKALFLIGGDLLDLIRENMLFGKDRPELVAKSIIIKKNIIWDFDSIGVETGQQIGTQRISVPMEQFCNFT